MRTLLVLILILAAAVPAASADTLPADEPLDLIWLHPHRPYRLRLHLRIGSRTAPQRWGDAVGELFRYLDVNGDGVLSKAEAGCAPSPVQWLHLLQGNLDLEPDAAPDFTALPGCDGEHITLAQLQAVYREGGAGPIQVHWGRASGQADALSQALFKQLDQDQDGKLSRSELQAAARLLQTLDADDDEMITSAELAPGVGVEVIAVQPIARRDLPPDFSLFPWSDLASKKQVQRLLRPHDGNQDQRLGRREAGLLSADELKCWPVDVEAVVPLLEGEAREVQVRRRPSGVVLAQDADGSLRLLRDGQQLQVLRVWSAAERRRAVRKPLEDRFPRGPDAVLTSRQIHQPPFTFVSHLRLADHNDDNQLSHSELTAYLDMVEKVVLQSTFVTLIDRGEQLFSFMDSDQDGRLSQRELRSAWTRMASLYPADKQAISKDELPRSLQVILSQGVPPAPEAGRGLTVSLVRERKLGPLWFRKMDRNQDGDVSRREFLGSGKQLQAIDTDGDGLIDVHEAEQADRHFRKDAAARKQRLGGK